MRTVYLGTSPFAVTVLERVARSEHRPRLVVTRPDRRRGRGRRLAPPPVAEAARALGLEAAQPDDVNSTEAHAQIAACEPEVVLVCAFGALIREPLLSDYEMLNVHPSLLPRWRGAAPIERAIEAGDTVTGVSIMQPTAEMDAGPVCLLAEEPIRRDDDYGSLSARLAELGGELLVEALERRPECDEQPVEGVTVAPKIEADDRRLDPVAACAADLERRVRALAPHIGAWVALAGATADGSQSDDRLGVHAARALEVERAPAPGALAADGDRVLLGCARGVLELLEVQPAGGRRMGAADWLRGAAAAFARTGAPIREPPA